MVMMFLPRIAKFFRLNAMDTEAGNFFIDLIAKAVDAREKSGARYNDFIDQVLDVLKGASMLLLKLHIRICARSGFYND